MATHCIITILPEPFEVGDCAFDIRVQTTFSLAWLEEFKRNIHRDDRFWSDGARAWYVASGFEGRNLTEVHNLGLKYFDLVEMVEGDTRANLKTTEITQQGSLFSL
jgi:hypothetical protein